MPVQIKLLRILALLGASDKAASDNMYAVVAEAMRKGNTGHTIGNAIVYEAVRTITNIYPNPGLLQSGEPMCSQPTCFQRYYSSMYLARSMAPSSVFHSCSYLCAGCIYLTVSSVVLIPCQSCTSRVDHLLSWP